MIELNNISFRYPQGQQALSCINLSIKDGEKLVVAGPNGSGKSTLFLVLNGILKPQTGNYCFGGKKVNYSNADLLQLRKNVGVVFQEPDSQIFAASVFDEVAFGPLNLQLPHNEVRQRVDMAMASLDIKNLKDRQPHVLSYGQKKRVTIASILAMDPQTIIFDEPTSGLDPMHAAEMIKLLEHLHLQGKTIIVSTHDMNFAYRWAKRMVVIHNGQVMADGAASEIFKNTSLINQCGLETPMIMQIHNALKSNMKVPVSIAELLEQIKALP